MRFWQAVVTGQLAAGAAWADQIEGSWSHLAADVGNIAVGAIAWLMFKRWLGTSV
jgi:hypothetical protein